MPPLRERADDIPTAGAPFRIAVRGQRMNRRIESITSETMSALCNYRWPGNIRELQNVLERAVILSSGPVLRVALSNLRTNGGLVSKESHPAKPDNQGNLRRFLEEAERQRILEALDETRWIVAGPRGAAAHLGVKRSTLQARIQKLGIARNR